MKKILIIAGILLATLVAAGLVAMHYASRDIDVESIAIETVDTPISDATIVKWEEEPQEKIIPPPTPEDDIQMTAIETPEKEKTREMSNRDKRRAEWAERMKDPEFQEKMKARMKEGMARRYNDLFEYLDLSDEEKDGFMDIVVSKFDAMRDLGRDIFGKGKMEISDETREMFNKVNEEFQSQMKDYLGDDLYEVYVQYEQTEPERRQVDRLNRDLSKNDSSLTTEQQDQLITSMYEEREASGVYVMNNFSELPDAEILTEEGRKQQIEDIKTLSQKYIEQGAEILTAEQQAEFEKNITRQAERQIQFISGNGGGRRGGGGR